ncbi:hypothetical protein BN14_10876 [Rhizoctonia solani AG-1 IB]|nr:unnamed protein product [Rhizoctonia solani]CCO36732.1 hypothetical protein BN14_10876 [Rhizoctonia solani AG-1 IB]
MALHSGSNNDGADGDALLVSPLYKDHDECWRLERIGHSSGGNSSTEEINQLNLQLKRIKKEAKKIESELNQVKDELSEKELECDSHSTQLTEAISELKLVKHELSEMELERDGLSTQLAEANTEKNEAKLGLIRAQEELDWKTAKLAEQEEELAEKESELVRKDAELTGVKSQLEAKEEEPIGKEDQLVHMSDQLNNKEEELSRAQKVIGEKDEEIGKPIERLFTNLKEREILRRMERISAENRIGLGKDHELSDKEEVPKRIQMEHAVNPRLDKKSSETASQSSGRSRAGTSFYSTGVDIKLADLGWDFDDSE